MMVNEPGSYGVLEVDEVKRNKVLIKRLDYAKMEL